MGTKNFSNANDLITFSRASGGTALRKVAYGSELVTNGTFDTDTDWDKGTGWSISGGVASYDGSGGTSAINQDMPVDFVVGRVYQLSLTVVSNTGAGVNNVYVTPTQQVSGKHLDAGTYVFNFSATSTNARVYVYGRSGETLVIDNISVKEVLFDQGDLTLFNHPADVPRIEYDADGNVLGLLVEESRTNLVTYSEDFEQWVDVNTDLTENAIEAPDGTTTATKLIADTATGQHRRDYLSTYSAGTYTFSIFAKVGGYNYLELRLGGDGVYVDIRDGSLGGASAGITTSYEDVGNGWKRIAITHSAGANDTVRINVVETSEQRDFTGDGTSGIYIWGAQLEAGAFPTSYIPTAGATATRSADVASIPVADFGYNQSEGTVFVEARNTENCDVLALIDDGSTDNRIRLYESGSNVVGLVSVNTTNVAVMVTTQSVATDELKAAIAVKKDDFATVANAGSLATDSAGDMSVGLTDLNIATSEAGVTNGAVHIKSIKYYPRRLTDAQLQELTT